MRTSIILSFCLVSMFCFNSEARRKPLPSHPEKIVYDSLGWQVPEGVPYRRILDNGLKTYIASDSAFPMVIVKGYIRYGTIGDPDGKEGCGYLLAELLRSGGTEKIPADSLDALLERLAISVSFSLSSSMLEFTCTFLSDFFDTAMFLIEQVLFHPSFEKRRFEKERTLAIEKIRHQFDNPEPLLNVAHTKAAYWRQCNSRLASEKSILSITRGDIVTLHEAIIRTDNMIVAASGKFDADTLTARLSAFFPAAEPSGTPFIFPDISLQPRGAALIVHKQLSQSYVRISLPGIKRPHPDYYPLSILDLILGGGAFSSRLNERVRSDAGLSYVIYSNIQSNYIFPGTFFIHFSTRTESTIDAIAIIHQEIARIRDEGVTIDELSTAQDMLVDALPSMFRSADNIVDNYAWSEYHGRADDHFRVYPDKIRALTRDDILRVARTYLVNDSMVYIVVTDTSALFPVDTASGFSLRGLPSALITTPDSLANMQ